MASETTPPTSLVVGGVAKAPARRGPSIGSEHGGNHLGSSLEHYHNHHHHHYQQQEQYLALRRASASNYDSAPATNQMLPRQPLTTTGGGTGLVADDSHQLRAQQAQMKIKNANSSNSNSSSSSSNHNNNASSNVNNYCQTGTTAHIHQNHSQHMAHLDYANGQQTSTSNTTTTTTTAATTKTTVSNINQLASALEQQNYSDVASAATGTTTFPTGQQQQLQPQTTISLASSETNANTDANSAPDANARAPSSRQHNPLTGTGAAPNASGGACQMTLSKSQQQQQQQAHSSPTTTSAKYQPARANSGGGSERTSGGGGSSSSNNNAKFAVRDETDVVFNRLMALEAFRKLHPSLIRNLCSYAFIDRIEKGVLVFRQGDDAINWYALLDGSVDVRVSQQQPQQQQQQNGPGNSGQGQQEQKDGVTLCTLGVGTTFGASVMPGKSHSVSVVTNEECTLLRVRRADFQEVFNEQSHLIHDVESSPLFPFSSLNKVAQSSDSGALTRIRSSLSSSLSKFSPPQRQASRQLHHHHRPEAGQPSGAGAPAGRQRDHLHSSGQQQAGAAARQSQASASSGNSSANSRQTRRASLVTAAAQAGQALASAAVDGHQQRQRARQLQASAYSCQDDDDQDNDQDEQDQTDQEAGELEVETQEANLEDDLNLDSLDSSELSSQLMRIGWVLRTLILAQTPQLIENRRIYPHLHHSLMQPTASQPPTPQQQQQQQQQVSSNKSPSSLNKSIKSSMSKHLVSRGSSSQLWATSNSSSNSNASSTTFQASTKSAGRKVANYVASSFMRTATGAGSSKQQNTATPSQQLYSLGSSFDNQHSSSSSGNVIAPANLHHQDHQHQHQTHRGHSGSRHQHEPPVSQEPIQLRRCLVGREMVDWLQQLSQTNTNAGRFVSSRLQAVSMWQVLLEQEIILSLPLAGSAPAANRASEQLSSSGGNKQAPAARFCDDSQAYYKFWFDCEHDSQAGASSSGGGGGGGGSASESAGAASSPSPPTESDRLLANDALWWSLKLLSKLAPDACFRLILSKQPHERTREEVDIVFEELQHLKALSHLTNSVKKQLAACVQSEHHSRQNAVIFNQGDVGHSWYIILRGSVNVVIVGKGVVCTLHDGDDFGKLALVNDAPRAATIVTNEPNCYFLRVDKHDFNTILRDVEANTVRLKEHGKEVLILQKVAIKEQSVTDGDNSQNSSSATSNLQAAAASSFHQHQVACAAAAGYQSEQNLSAQAAATMSLQAGQPAAGLDNNQTSGAFGGAAAAATQLATGQQQLAGSAVAASALQQAQACALKYMVMAGTAEKMLEHLLETRIDGQTQTAPLPLTKWALFQHDQVANYVQCHCDNFLEDFILTHKIFMPTGNLCQELLKQYQSSQAKAAALNSNSGNNNNNNNGQRQQHQLSSLDDEYLVAKKRRVVKFVRFWMLINREHFFQQQQIQTFVMTLHQRVKLDAQRFASLQPELKAISRIYELQLEENLESRHRGCQRWIEDVYGNILPIRRHSGSWQAPACSTSSASSIAESTSQMAASEQFLASLHQRRFEHKLSTIQLEDELVFRVYCADHSYTTLKCRFDEQAGQIKQVAARNLKLDDKELILVHVKSNGERIIYNDLETNICTCLSVNGRLFVCPLDHIDAISPLPEQDPFQEVYQSLASIKQQQAALDENRRSTTTNSTTISNSNSNSNVNSAAPPTCPTSTPTPTTTATVDNSSQQGLLTTSNSQNQANQQEAPAAQSNSPISSHLLASMPSNYADIKLQMSLSVSKLEEFSSRDIAYCLTQLARSLLKNMHEFELVYTVFGRHNFKQNTANLNVFLRHFNEIQYWVVSQICLSTSLSKRVQILRKFIKIAAHCKDLQNLNAFFAIIMGLSNMAVARLTQTWERLPSKLKRTFSQFESQIDPSRNHCRYRLFLSKLEPPIVPFMPLLLKDMTFAHEGNKTYLENGLINFEKMQMIAQTLRTIRLCKSRPTKLDPSACKFKSSARSIELFFRDLKIIDNQRTLTQMSHQLEHRKA